MPKIEKISAKMVPAVEASTHTSVVGDISLVPACRARLVVGEERLDAVGIIDSGSEFSIIEESLLKSLSTRPKNGVRVNVSTGLCRKKLWMYSLDVILFGDTDKGITLQNVPIVVANLDRKVFIVGRRGILDKLKISLDFPRGTVDLSLERSSSVQYPSLSQQFPNLDQILDAFSQGNSAGAVMKLAWEIEGFLDTIMQEEPALRVHKKSSWASAKTVHEKLRQVAYLTPQTNLDREIQQLANARNIAAHSSATDMGDISMPIVMAAAEAIVAEFSNLLASQKAAGTYYLYMDRRGEWRWRLTAANGRVIADSAQGYLTKHDALNDIERVRGTSDTPVVES